jgi:peptide methionine sulfoxide reductase msrA/msrB
MIKRILFRLVPGIFIDNNGIINKAKLSALFNKSLSLLCLIIFMFSLTACEYREANGLSAESGKSVANQAGKGNNNMSGQDLSGEFFYKDDKINPNAKPGIGESVDIADMGTKSRAEIYLAAGCFWGSEAYFKRVFGILDTEVGYANGKSGDTNYQKVAETDHAETVKLTYDPNKIHLAEILERYYRIIDPFSINKQGNDQGRQYRTGIYYTDEKSGALAQYSLKVLEEIKGKAPAIECQPLKNFVPAEEYHQDYLDKNPGGYCHINLFAADEVLFPGSALPSDKELREKLSDTSYNVIRERGTERPFSSPYDSQYEDGIYVDIATGQPLFSSADKFDGGCGWPSFSMPITTDAAQYSRDQRLMRERIEVSGDSTNHLGHVFDDGPEDLGSLRYCINGAALQFIPFDKMDEAGYSALKPFVKKVY